MQDAHPAWRSAPPWFSQYPICPHRISYVLDHLIAELVDIERELVLDLLVDTGGYANAARVGQYLQPGGNVYTVAKQIIVLNHHVAEIDSNPKTHPLIFGMCSFKLIDLLLDIQRGPNRLHRAH